MNFRFFALVMRSCLIGATLFHLNPSPLVSADEPPAVTPTNQAPAPATADQRNAEAFFETKIRPVLVETCYRCHGDAKVSGGLRVDSREALIRGGDSGPAIQVGKSSESLLVQAIRRADDVSAMPPDKDRALRADQVRDFATWIDSGALWPEKSTRFESTKHWAFQPPRRAPLPTTTRDPWCQTVIDEWIRRGHETAKVTPAPRAPAAVLLRRVTFDLTGLPPTPAELREFETDIAKTNFSAAWERVVERLLASRAYGERWARHWLDVVRYADTAGETADYPVPLAWRYRNYVIDAFHTDKPYDQFVQEQIAGDILATEGPREKYAERVTATGFLAISRRFGFDSENYHHLTIQDTIDTIGQSILGLSLGCARCHDHKFDAISIQDYYALYGIFDSTRYAFPGSEQKQRVRTLAPLVPPGEAQAEWRRYQGRLQQLAERLAALQQPVASVVLRSLVDCDGDFELQAPAAGGSYGVLVPPWLFQGSIAVTTAAQSPFKHVYPSGRVGASVPASTAAYRIEQKFQPQQSSPPVDICYLNLDLRLSGSAADATGVHRLLLGSGPGQVTCELILAPTGLHLQLGDKQELLAPLALNSWQNIQLAINTQQRTIAGRCGAPGAVTEFAARTLATSALSTTSSSSSVNSSSRSPNTIDYVAIVGDKIEAGSRAALEIDNFAYQATAFPPVSLKYTAPTENPAGSPSSTATAAATAEQLSPTAIEAQLRELAGRDGDFELQRNGSAPTSPWNPGPNSVVKLVTSAQSPYRNIYPAGQLGIQVPNRAAYDGFGWTVPDVKADAQGRLHLAFDFRLGDQQAGGQGSWRYYVGQGAGNSAAIELFFNGSQFFRRSGDARGVVGKLESNRWYQVRLVLDMNAKTYTGQLEWVSAQALSPTGEKPSVPKEPAAGDVPETQLIEFSGQCATGWTGRIDYSFIDSYGHLPGTRPALDADNFILGDQPLQSLAAPRANAPAPDQQARQEKIAALRRQLDSLRSNADRDRREYEDLLLNGPFPMTYGMSEGTPHQVRVQLRGEPDQLGVEVPRGFLKLLGGAPLPATATGSGRRELAVWLTSRDNPLTARVMVNRIWQNHFGQGLVKTANDFGARGQPPSHPELLDVLAVEFMEHGWSVKHIHRLILRSAVYQQATDDNSQDQYRGFVRRRLSAEEIRDSILAVSGQLDTRPGEGHTFPSPLQWGFSQHGPFSAVYDHQKRSIYLMTQRLKRHPYLALFDGADPNATTPLRLGTTVPTQALFFLNDPFLHASAQAWSASLQQLDITDSARVQQVFLQAYGRAATGDEERDAERFLADYMAALIESSSDVGKPLAGLSKERQRELQTQAWAAYLRSIIGSNEFLHVD